MRHPLPRELPAPVSRETTARLATFVDLLVRWNKRINLIGPVSDEDTIWRRHISDSLQLSSLLDGAPWGEAADIGSGAGFPGMVLAIATNRCFHLIESDRRKAAFLLEAGRATGTAVTVHPKRAEDLAGLLSVSLVTGRAVAPLRRLLEMAAPLLAPDAFCVFLKGRSVDDELTPARRQWQMNVQRFPSQTDPHGSILRISDLRRLSDT